MTLAEYLEPFLAKLEVNEDGDFLKGRTREEVIRGYMGFSVTPTLAGELPPGRREICERTVDKNIQEWKDHIGDKLAYVIVPVTDRSTATLEVVKEWASTLTEDKWEVNPLRDDEHDSIPRLIRKQN